MQELMQAALIGVMTAFICVVMRSLKPEFAFAAGAAGSVCALLLALPALRETAGGLMEIAAAGKMDESAALCLRAALIVLLCEFAASLCRDAGENTLAGRVEFCGRAFLCAMSVPLLSDIVASLGSLSLFSR